jgi:hypothetical protein
MPVIASLTKIAVLAVAFTCVGIGAPPIDQGMAAVEAGASSPRLHCRLYFGCTPRARKPAGGLITDWSEFDVFTP